MIDPTLSLAFSMQASPGIYALLLGSGLSRSAGIPTGWEIVLDLIRKLANMEGEDCEPDPVAWYEGKYHDVPDYSKLLKTIAKTPTERKQLLKPYFEPNRDEEERGLKQPTEAHKAIAELVTGGYIRVIITTNFDRLIEKALEKEGVIPTVISTPDAAEGALPLVHSRVLVIKVHGDYLDSRIKNTPEELAIYDKPIEALLNRVLDEFGLIVSGWSAEWDAALCNALERCKSFRFACYWAVRDEAGESARRLIDLRQAQVLHIKDADTLFRDLAEKVFSLQTFSKPHPLSAKTAVATLKRYVVDRRYRISLHDLVMEETERLVRELNENQFPTEGVSSSKEEIIKRIDRYEALAEILSALVSQGCYWGDEEHESLWIKSFERVVNLIGGRTGNEILLNLHLYPALLILYSGGIAAVTAERYRTLAALLLRVKIREGSEEFPVGLSLGTDDVLSFDYQKMSFGNYRSPLSDHLFTILRNPLKEILPDEVQYQKKFDLFEYIFCLNYCDLREKNGFTLWAPAGCFGWRYRRSPEKTVQRQVDLEIEKTQENWGPIGAGFFDGSLERLKSIKSEYDEMLKRPY